MELPTTIASPRRSKIQLRRLHKFARSALFEPFIAAAVLPRLPLSFRRDLQLKLLIGTRRMFGKMTVVVLAKTKKQRGAGIQDRRQRATQPRMD